MEKQSAHIITQSVSMNDSDYFDSLTRYMILDIYPSGESNFTLFDDKPIEITCLERDGSITINLSNVNKYYLLKIHYPDINTVSVDGKVMEKRDSTPELKSSSSGWVQDKLRNIVIIKAFLSGQPVVHIE